MASILTFSRRYRLTERDEAIFLKCSVPNIYAIWEGFMVNVGSFMSRVINQCDTQACSLKIKLVTHVLDNVCKFSDPKNGLDKQVDHVEKILEQLSEPLEIPASVPTQSNVNFKVANSILDRFCIEPIENSYKQKLDRLLFFRNSIAHGETSLPLELSIINEFVTLVNDLMDSVFQKFEFAVANKTFLNN